MAVKRHRQGADCSSLLNLLFCEWRIFYHAKHIGKETALSKIIRGSLLVRNQSVFPLQPRKTVGFLFETGSLICSHYYWRVFGPCAPTYKIVELYKTSLHLLSSIYMNVTGFSINNIRNLGGLPKINADNNNRHLSTIAIIRRGSRIRTFTPEQHHSPNRRCRVSITSQRRAAFWAVRAACS